MLLPARVCPRLVPQASDALPGLGRAVHHQRDKSGQCEGRREEGECEHRDGLDPASVTYGAADFDALRAAQANRLSRTFRQLTVVQATVPQLAGKQEAPIISTRQRGRVR